MMKVIEFKILLKVKKGMTQKIGGLEIPVEANEYEIGDVLSVGEKVSGIKPGDTVYFYTGAGKSITHEGENYRVINSNEVIVVLEA